MVGGAFYLMESFAPSLGIPEVAIVPLAMTVEEAIKMVISGGIVTPPDHRPIAEQKIAQISAATYENVDIVREQDRAAVLVPKKD